MKEGLGLRRKISAFDLYLSYFLLLCDVSISRKLLKTTHTEERSIHTNSENCNNQQGSPKNLFNSKQIIQILRPIIIDFFRRIRIRLIFHNILWLFYIQCNEDFLSAKCNHRNIEGIEVFLF